MDKETMHWLLLGASQILRWRILFAHMPRPCGIGMKFSALLRPRQQVLGALGRVCSRGREACGMVAAPWRQFLVFPAIRASIRMC